MIWIKSVLAGFTAALVTVVAIVIATTRVYISGDQGSGGISTVSFGISELVLVPFALAFALGFRWMFRRQRRRASPARPA